MRPHHVHTKYIRWNILSPAADLLYVHPLSVTVFFSWLCSAFLFHSWYSYSYLHIPVVRTSIPHHCRWFHKTYRRLDSTLTPASIHSWASKQQQIQTHKSDSTALAVSDILWHFDRDINANYGRCISKWDAFACILLVHCTKTSNS